MKSVRRSRNDFDRRQTQQYMQKPNEKWLLNNDYTQTMTMPDKIQFLCSCAEYLCGSGKPTKKKSICKQCKGIKLPFAPIGGTVRLFPTSYVLDAATKKNYFQTVRLPSNSFENQRQTVLCRDHDPYDFLRQSRLLCTNRSNDLKVSQQYHNASIPSAYVRPNATASFESFSIAPSHTFKNRANLQKLINPYELIATTLHNNEFSPSKSLFNLMGNGETQTNNIVGTASLRKRNVSNRLLDILPNRSNDRNNVSTSLFGLPSPVSNLESSSFAVETIKPPLEFNPNERVYEERKLYQVESFSNENDYSLKPNLKLRGSNLTTQKSSTTGRCKKVQFHTLPELQRKNENKLVFNEFDENTFSKANQKTEIQSNSQNNYSTSDKTDHISTELKRKSFRRKTVMRSLSDRRDKESKETLNFKDTTALRTKHRTSHHQVLPKLFNAACPRPTCPPPQLPDVTQNQCAPQRPPRQQKKTTNQIASPSTSAEETKASRIFGLLPVSTISRNKIKISAPPKLTCIANNKESDKFDASIQRTSIVINSGECLSNVNVNGSNKLHHSSVLIKSIPAQVNNEKEEKPANHTVNVKNEEQSTLLSEDSATEISIYYHNKNSNTSKNAGLILNVNKTKTLICLDFNERLETVENSKKNLVSTDDSANSANKTVENKMAASKPFVESLILKFLDDPYLSHLLYGLEMETITSVIERSLSRLCAGKFDMNAKTIDDSEMEKIFLKQIHDIMKKERIKFNETQIKLNENINTELDTTPNQICSYRDGDNQNPVFNLNNTNAVGKTYEKIINSKSLKTESAASEFSDDHQYESICSNCDPIYEEIDEKPPPLPKSPPPITKRALNKPMFLGATKYDILSYLVDAKERIVAPDDSYTFKFSVPSTYQTAEKSVHNDKEKIKHVSSFNCNNETKSSENLAEKCLMASIERNDSGVGSETSKTSRTKYQPLKSENKSIPIPIHLCEDCDDPLEMIEESDIYTIVCRCCEKKRAERREILWEFIETEKKYNRDLQIIIDEFYQPMLVAGLLTQEQLSAIFLNIEELLENSEIFCSKIRNAFDTAIEQGDDDLLTVDIGKIILENSSMLCAFETYCIRQAAASLLLANMEKDKELLRIFLRVSQMENTVLRRMNLNSFLMVPVQRVTKYPLLLARLYKVTPSHLEIRIRLKEAQEKIESHLNIMNREAKDISTKLWRRLSSNPLRSRENDIISIKLRKIAMDYLEWNHEKVNFVVEGRLLITHPTDNNWRRGRTIKLTQVNGLLMTNDMTSNVSSDHSFVNFPRNSSNKEAAFILIREKSGRYIIYREPFYLDRCVICTESDDYFEIHEISSKDSFIFKAEDDARTKQWYTQLQYHAQGTGSWRKRRAAFANIMINGMMVRS